MSNNNKDNNEKEDWLGKLVFWLTIIVLVFGVTTLLEHLNKPFQGKSTYLVETLVLLAIVMWASLDGIFRKK